MEEKLQQLKTRLMEISDLNSAASLLGWDQMTYMPPGGAPARARQTALLQRLAHEKSIDPALGKLLDDLQPYGESSPVCHKMNDQTSASSSCRCRFVDPMPWPA